MENRKRVPLREWREIHWKEWGWGWLSKLERQFWGPKKRPLTSNKGSFPQQIAIEGCEQGGINSFDNKLADDIIERIGQEETEESIFWDGFTAHYELNVFNIPVNTNLEVKLKSNKKEEAIAEVKKFCDEKNLFDGYEWKIENCDEVGINDLNETLKNKIIEVLAQEEYLEACIEESA